MTERSRSSVRWWRSKWILRGRVGCKVPRSDMDFLLSAPIWVTAIVIFGLRVLDVSLGTVRTLAVVQGRIRASVVLGFFEIFIWVTAIGQVVTHLNESLLLPVAYAGGFAVGNATGILIERRIAWGLVIVRFLSSHASHEIVTLFRKRGQWAAVFSGQSVEGSESLVFVSCSKAMLREMLDAARKLDPDVVYSVEPVLEAGPLRSSLVQATGWRGRFLRK